MAMMEIPNSCTPVCAPAAPCVASLRAVCVRPYAAHPSACGVRAWLRVVCDAQTIPQPIYSLEGNSPTNLTTGIALPGAYADYQIVDMGQCSCGAVETTLGGVGATATNQTLQLAELTAINAGIPAALGQTTMANSVSTTIASDQSPIPTNPLKRPVTARQLAAIATSASVQTTAGVVAVSMIARGADIRYRVTAVAGTAVATDHLIIQNERLDIAVLSAGFISAIRDAATSGVLEISELV